MPSLHNSDFVAPIHFNRTYASRATLGESLILTLERESGFISRFETWIIPQDPETLRYVERIVKFLIWSRGGWKLTVGGSNRIADAIRKEYSRTGSRAFDVDLMERVYGKPFEVIHCPSEMAPLQNEMGSHLGGHLDGCRIGFDLGASDYKIAAVRDGEVIFSEEYPWSPRNEAIHNITGNI